MSVFDDDEDEQSEGATAGARVAAALNPQEEDEPADDGPDTRADSQASAKQSAQKDAPEDGTAQEIAQSTPYEGVSNPPDEPITTDDESGDVAEAGTNPDEDVASLAGYTPVKAPTAPTLKPYSTAPVEAAQELANAKSSFDPSQYRPSGLRRAGAAIAGALTAFGSRNPEEGTRVGEMALNGPLDRARQQEAQKEQGIQSQIDAGNLQNQATEVQNKNALNEYGLEERQMRNTAYADSQAALAESRRATATARQNAPQSFVPDDPSDPYKGGTLTTVGGKTTKGAAPPDEWIAKWAKTPDGQAASVRMSTDARRKVADSIFGKGSTSEKQEYIATGKISRAARVSVPSAAEEKYNDWKSQFAKDNGRPPNAAEISAFGHVASGAMSKNLSDRIESQKNSQIAQAEKDYHDGLIDQDEYLNRWQDAQDEFEQRIYDATGQDVPHVKIRDNVDTKTMQWHGQAPAPGPHPAEQVGQQMQAQGQQKPAQAQAQAPQQAQGKTVQYKGRTYTIGAPVNVNGQTKTILGINPQTGKLQVK